MSLPAVFDATLFELRSLPDAFPRSFAIVTAFAPTGESWPAARNAAADRALRAEIEAGGWHAHRVTGWAPVGGGPEVHAEPGWAVGCSRDEGVALGARFQQVGVWWVAWDRLELVSCFGDESRWLECAFSERQRWRPEGAHHAGVMDDGTPF